MSFFLNVWRSGLCNPSSALLLKVFAKRSDSCELIRAGQAKKNDVIMFAWHVYMESFKHNHTKRLPCQKMRNHFFLQCILRLEM